MVTAWVSCRAPKSFHVASSSLPTLWSFRSTITFPIKVAGPCATQRNNTHDAGAQQKTRAAVGPNQGIGVWALADSLVHDRSVDVSGLQRAKRGLSCRGWALEEAAVGDAVGRAVELALVGRAATRLR